MGGTVGFVCASLVLLVGWVAPISESDLRPWAAQLALVPLLVFAIIAGMMAQFPHNTNLAVAAAVYLHGRAGELGAAALGEKPLLATDLLHYLPAALEECARLSNFE